MRICALSTIPYYGYGFRMFPYAEERPDRMNLRIATIGPLSFVRHFGEIWRGEYENEEEVTDFLVDAVTIEVDPVTDFQIAGDPRGPRSSISALLSPQPIRLVDFYAPPHVA
jgi:diacylglycerol kinase family enzyme